MRYVFILLVILVVYAVVDCIRTADADMPAGLPKAVWVVLIVVFPGAGAIAWLVVSRVTRHAQRAPTPGPTPFGRPPRPTPRRPVTRQVAPDDDPEFLASLNRPDPEPKSDEQPDRGAPGQRDAADDPSPDDDADDSGGSAAGGKDEDGGPGTQR